MISVQVSSVVSAAAACSWAGRRRDADARAARGRLPTAHSAQTQETKNTKTLRSSETSAPQLLGQTQQGIPATGRLPGNRQDAAMLLFAGLRARARTRTTRSSLMLHIHVTRPSSSLHSTTTCTVQQASVWILSFEARERRSGPEGPRYAPSSVQNRPALTSAWAQLFLEEKEISLLL